MLARSTLPLITPLSVGGAFLLALEEPDDEESNECEVVLDLTGKEMISSEGPESVAGTSERHASDIGLFSITAALSPLVVRDKAISDEQHGLCSMQIFFVSPCPKTSVGLKPTSLLSTTTEDAGYNRDEKLARLQSSLRRIFGDFNFCYSSVALKATSLVEREACGILAETASGTRVFSTVPLKRHVPEPRSSRIHWYQIMSKLNALPQRGLLICTLNPQKHKPVVARPVYVHCASLSISFCADLSLAFPSSCMS